MKKLLLLSLAHLAAAGATSAAERRRNNLVADLLVTGAVSKPGSTFTFTRADDGWIFIAAAHAGAGESRLLLDAERIVRRNRDGAARTEAMRHVKKGEHQLRLECDGDVRVEVVVRAIPELVHCGLGYDPALKSYGRYDLEFLKKDVLPNVTTLIVPHNIDLPRAVSDDWHGQGKRFVAEVGIRADAKTADEHVRHWAGYFDKAPLLDGIIVNEFIVNNPRPDTPLSPERQARLDGERQRYRDYETAIKQLRADPKYQGKAFYGYVGGSGKKLNRDVIGPTFVRGLLDSGGRIGLERYLHEMSSEQGAEEALKTFAEGIADWEAKEPGVKKQMLVVFGLFSMPPGGLNKLPNVDYHVWMDRQMQVLATHPALAGVGGIEWWTSLQADEETVRFAGKLYRHYAIEGRTDRLTRDPLFTSHLRNADFERGLEGWTMQAAEAGTIEPRSFPRYGRIEGRFMGLGRPPDPEHIGDTFLWMKRSAKGPNTFSQTIRNLEPGRLYSMKMFTCDYQDLVNSRAKTKEQATGFLGEVTLEGVELDARRSFVEAYASNPEPRIPVWITYHWKVFRAKGPTAKLTVSDWPNGQQATAAFGQEQAFNFLEIEPYHD